MSVDFSGRWKAKPASDAFLPAIEAGMISVKIDHVEPLLQVIIAASAPGYAFGNFVLNYRTDGTEVVTTTHGMQVQTNAYWDKGDELIVDLSIVMGSFRKYSQTSWRLSNGDKVLTMRHREGALAGRITVLHKQEPEP